MKQFLSFLPFVLFALISIKANSQFTVYGTVLDSATNEVLPGASVFCQNTTLGAATNKQGEFLLQLKSGGYDLVISYTGYQTQRIRINAGENSKLEVLLIQEDKSLGEVVIQSSNEVANGWEKYGDFFTKNFIGTTPNANQCYLLNPEVLKFYFYKRSNKLKILATDPLQISNKSLGYELRYLLDSFVYYYNSDLYTYTGYSLFSEMDGSDSLIKIWANNRSKA